MDDNVARNLLGGNLMLLVAAGADPGKLRESVKMMAGADDFWKAIPIAQTGAQKLGRDVVDTVRQSSRPPQ